MNAVPKDVKEAGLNKWYPGTIYKTLVDDNGRIDYEAFNEWWDETGDMPCSFCVYFSKRSRQTQQYRCHLCPLHVNPTHTCAPEWDKLDKISYFDPEQFTPHIGRCILKHIQDMYDRIKAVPVLEEEK